MQKGNGRPADGYWIPDGREIRFKPKGPRRSDLMDGGFEPGASYELTLDGFPLPSGPRSIHGAALRSPVRYDFQVVARPTDARPPTGLRKPRHGTQPFDERRVLRDASPDRCAPLELRRGDPGSGDGTPLAWDAPLVLSCAEPLDPRWFRANDFEARELRPSGRGPVGEEPQRVGVESLQLLSNEDEDERGDALESGALLRVTFKENLPLTDGSMRVFEFALKDGATGSGGVFDFSGHPADVEPIKFRVARRDALSSRAQRELRPRVLGRA